MQPIQVFFCYSHSDEELRDRLADHLTMLKRQQVISAWYDREITAGSDWAGAIDAHLNTAQIILLLVSASFLASDYCYDVELARAMERHRAVEARVIPIILRPCDWETAAFGNLRALPKNGLPITKWGDRDEAFLNVVQGIRAAILQLQNPEEVAAPPIAFSTAAMGLMSTVTSMTEVAQPSQHRVEVKRRFEAAMPRLAKVARTTEVRAMVSLSDSLGLRAHLPDFTEEGDLISKKDTVDNEFPFEFPVDQTTAEPMPTNVYLSVNAPGFDVREPVKALYLAPRLDSGVVTFFLTPTQRQERARVAVELFKDSSKTTLLSSLSLVTEVIGQQDELAQTVWQLVSLPFTIMGRFKPANAPEPEQWKEPDRPDMLSASAASDESEEDIEATTDAREPVRNLDPELLASLQAALEARREQRLEELQQWLSFPKPSLSPPLPPAFPLSLPSPRPLQRLEVFFNISYWLWVGSTAIAFSIFVWLGISSQLAVSATGLAIYGLLAGLVQGLMLRRSLGMKWAILWVPLTVGLYLAAGNGLGLTAFPVAIAPVRYLVAAIAVGSFQWVLLRLRRNP